MGQLVLLQETDSLEDENMGKWFYGETSYRNNTFRKGSFFYASWIPRELQFLKNSQEQGDALL